MYVVVGVAVVVSQGTWHGWTEQCEVWFGNMACWDQWPLTPTSLSFLSVIEISFKGVKEETHSSKQRESNVGQYQSLCTALCSTYSIYLCYFTVPLADLEEVGHKTLKHMFTVHSATENDDFVLLA